MVKYNINKDKRLNDINEKYGLNSTGYCGFSIMNLIENYQKALDSVYEHVGFKEEWVVCPLDDCTEYYWYANEDIVRFALTLEQFNSDGDYYEDDIYTQRFYKKWIYEGADFTMIFCDPHTDGMKWFRLFDNKKRILNLRKLKLNN